MNGARQCTVVYLDDFHVASCMRVCVV